MNFDPVPSFFFSLTKSNTNLNWYLENNSNKGFELLIFDSDKAWCFALENLQKHLVIYAQSENCPTGRAAAVILFRCSVILWKENMPLHDWMRLQPSEHRKEQQTLHGPADKEIHSFYPRNGKIDFKE